MKPKDHSDPRPACSVENVARVLAEEPKLEAVAFQARSKKLAMATLGDDPGQRLAKRVTEAMLTGDAAALQCGVLSPDGTCLRCGELLDARTAGMGRVVVKQVLGSTLIEKQTCTTAIHFWRWQNLLWPKFVTRAPQPLRTHDAAHSDGEWRTLAWLSAGCLAAGLCALAIEKMGAPIALPLLFWAAAYVCGAWEAAQETRERLQAGHLDVHFLMLAVAVGAAAIGSWHEGALLLFLFSASGAMEHYAMDRTQREIGALLRGAPKTAVVLDTGGRERIVPVEELVPGDVVRVTGGQQVPVDLHVIKGESACDESNLTGESRPVAKSMGDEAYSGTLNLDGILEGQVLRPASQSALQRVIHLIENAQKLRAPAQRFTDRFGTGYTYGILGLCGAMFFVWWLGFHLPPFFSNSLVKSAFYRTMTLLVVASPCALVLSIPSAILSAIAFGARRGVLFRGGAALESLAAVEVAAFDKTGTLTEGDLRLFQIDCLQGTEERLIEIAYNLARFSDHPLSRALALAGRKRRVRQIDPARFESVPGHGLRAEFDHRTYVLGRRELALASAADAATFSFAAAPDGAAEVWVAGPELAGRLLFRDQLRAESTGLLRQLAAAGIRTVMLTGDRRATAERLGREVGMEEVRAELLPEQKLAAIQELKCNGTRRVAMVGDGVNDAPCLAAADVGVAMGARGSDAALEQAAVILMNDRLENFLLAYLLSRRTRAVIRQNLTVALGTVVLMVAFSLLGMVPLALGVGAHEGSTVLVVLNSLRLLFGRASPKS